MKEHRAIIYLIAAATFIKLALLFFISGPSLWEDHDIAVNFLNTGDMFYRLDGARFFTYQFPVYPFFIAAIYKVFGISPLVAVAFNVLLNGFTALALYFFAKDFMKYFLGDSAIMKWQGKLTAALLIVFLLHPAINYYALCNVHPFSSDLFFLSLSLLFSMRYLLKASAGNMVFYSLVLGLTILERASLVVVMAPLLIVLYQSKGFQEVSLFFIKVTLIASLIVAPWLVRNYFKEGIIGFESSVARDLWKGSMPEGQGDSYLTSGKNYYSALSEEERQKLYKMNPKEQHDFFIEKYKSLWAQNPQQVVKMYFLKLKNFWWFRENIGNEYPQQIRSLLPFYKIFYGSILLFSVLSLFLVRRSFTLFALPVTLSLLQSVFYVETRHRMIIEPLLILLSLLAFAEIWHRYHKKRSIGN